MGLIEFFLFIFFVVFLGFLTVFGIKKLAPEHPGYVENIVWFVVILLIVVVLAKALGLAGYDPQIPRLR